MLIDRQPDIDNVWFIGRESGHGLKHRPTVEAYVTALLTGSSQTKARFTLDGYRT